MQRGSDHSGGLGPQLVGEKIVVNRRVVSVVRQLGEGAFVVCIHCQGCLFMFYMNDGTY